MAERFDFGTVAPLGICARCLGKFADGSEGLSVKIFQAPNGGRLFALYCREHRAGCWSLVRPGRQLEWTTR